MGGWWNELTAAIAADMGTMSAGEAGQLVFRILIAGLIGALFGWDRTRLKKSAGLRTHILVAVGSAAFVVIPLQAGYAPDSISRILQGLVAGIGFLGAGSILKNPSEEQIQGLTTAAGIWLIAAVGVAAGLGRVPAALILGALGWFTLAIVHRWEHHIPTVNGKEEARRPK